MHLFHLLAAPLLLTTVLSAPAFEQFSTRAVGNVGAKSGKTTKPTHVDTKYFHEAGDSSGLGHYEMQHFHGELEYDERHDTLKYLIRSYLTVFRERNIETWLAHGTLLGWWWNGQIMPWDTDLDVQVSAPTLTWLGQNLNMTTHNYTWSNAEGGFESREYLLDINPNHVSRVRGDGMNVIDARWIDVRNGMFIDITGLAENNPGYQPGIWSCKNNHRYKTRDLYPLRETMFEGVPGLVPYSFESILSAEYTPRALTKTIFEGHIWEPKKKEWVKQEVFHPAVPKSNPQSGKTQEVKPEIVAVLPKADAAS